MRQLAGKAASLWIETGPSTSWPKLEGEVSADVAVVGGGITGVICASLLQADGASVAIVEAGRIGRGVTGYTTAKVSSLHELTYARLRSSFGPEGARTHGEANEAGLACIVRLAEELGIECDLRRKANYTYTESRDELDRIEREVEAAQQAGLPASFVAKTPLPFEVAGAVRFEDQAEFHPCKFVAGLADSFARRGGLIFEQTPARDIHEGDDCRVEADGGAVRAQQVIIATHFPFLDRGLFFARMHASRSYVIAVRAPRS